MRNEAPETTQPFFCTAAMLDYLDALKDGEEVNMDQAASWVYHEFPELDRRQAGQVLLYWQSCQ